MRIAIVLAAIVFVVGSFSVDAQTLTPSADTMVFDANGKFMGAFEPGFLRFRLSDGRTVFLNIAWSIGPPSPTSQWTPDYVFFAGAFCTGAAYIYGNAYSGLAHSAIAVQTNDLYVSPPGAVASLTTYLSQRCPNLGGCISTVGGGILYPADLYVNLDTLFVQPFSLAGGPAPVITPSFGDVPSTHPFYEYIELMKAAGITAGCGGGNYCPDAAVTRGQMAVFLVRVLGLRWTP